MNPGIKLTLVLFCYASFLNAQVNPPQGSKLNYTQIMFEYEKTYDADEYIVQVAYDTTAGFDSLVAVQNDNSTATLISHFQFGKKYIWRYAAVKTGKQLPWKGNYNFEIIDNPGFNMKLFRGRVLKNDTVRNVGGLVAVDYSKLIIDREGNPVWYLPGLNSTFMYSAGPRDLRITREGTFLFMANNTAYECGINGNVLWKAPNNGKISTDTTEYYHHDFKKLSNGNYMILGEKYSWRTIPDDFDISKFRRENLKITDTSRKVKIMFNTIIEYNKSGKVIWSWNSADYFSDLDLFSKTTNTNLPRRDLPANAEIFGHMNSFNTDSTGNKFVYASFRDVSRVIKIEKSTGKVVESWGAKMPSGEADQANDFFINQHDLNVLSNGNIVLFNNNDMMNNSNSSSVVEFSPRNRNTPSKIIWQFDCKFDSLTTGKSTRNGSVEGLPNHNMLISMGGVNRLVEVNKLTNKIVWDAFLESKPTDTSTWNPLTIYKAHYATSLYPCYFTVQSNKDLISTNDPNAIVSVYNEGTNSDSYIIQVQSPTGKNYKKIETGIIVPGKSKSIKISMDIIDTKDTSWVVLINSKTNPDLLRKLIIQMRR